MRPHFIAILLFTFAAPAFAQENSEEGPASPAELEKAYQYICVPGSKAGLEIPQDQQVSEAESRAKFLAFLDQPEEFVNKLADGIIAGNSIDKFIGSIALGVTCGVAEALKEKIETNGCKGEDGKEHSAAKALAVCATASARIKQAEGSEESL